MKLHMWGFTNFDTIKIFKNKEKLIDIEVCFERTDCRRDIKKDVFKTVKKARKKDLKVIAEYNGPVTAPIKKDQKLGILKIYFKNELIDEHSIYASNEVKKVNMFSRLSKSINYLIWGDV